MNISSPQPPGNAPGSNPPPAPISLDQARATAVVKNAASWWFWIAGLTVVNCVLELFNGGMHFALGTGITQLFDGIALQGSPSPTAKGIAVTADLVVVGLIALWGVICGRGLRWAFVVGMILYALDAALIFLIAPTHDWLSIAFHAYALYRIGMGIPASAQLQQAKLADQQAAASFMYAPSQQQQPGEWPPAPLADPTPTPPPYGHLP